LWIGIVLQACGIVQRSEDFLRVEVKTTLRGIRLHQIDQRQAGGAVLGERFAQLVAFEIPAGAIGKHSRRLARLAKKRGAESSLVLTRSGYRPK